MAFSAKEVQVLRQATGAGMMDCKKALEEANGDLEAAKLWLREKGLSASAKRDDRDNAQGVVALLVKGNVGAMVKLKCETDFVASSDGFKAEADALVALVLEKGEASIAERATKLEDLKILLKEKIEIGVALRNCSTGLVFKKGEKILIDRSVRAPTGYVYGRIGLREGMIPLNVETVTI